ncbi:hypothetical protein [Absidia glauca]|uniref:F-box domain-containing protein n=1 Tax=Absidia glauca TaxID=4829 RepID=A0A168LXH0_ABSGL|nr:hypothetical protein [Absidia glauca]
MVGSFALLPSEVVPLILDNITSQKDLYHCTLVNKLFYATTVARLWRAPLVRESLVVYTPFLERLGLVSSFGYVMVKHLDQVWRYCPRLVEVSFGGCSGESDNLFFPLLAIKKLTVLTFVDFEWINSDLITSVICRLHQLEQLEIINKKYTRRAFFQQLLPTPTHPKNPLKPKDNPAGGDFNFYAKEVILFLATHPLLEIIHVYLNGIENHFFSSVAGHPNLCTIRLLSGPAYGLESEYVRSMVIACPRLTTLWLPQDCGLPDRCFPEVDDLYVNGFFCLDSLTIASIRQNPDLHFIDQGDDDQAIDKTLGTMGLDVVYMLVCSLVSTNAIK